MTSSWRLQDDHRAESKAVKTALADAGLPVTKVGHGTGTAWGWLDITLAAVEGPHIKHDGTTMPEWICRSDCPTCAESTRQYRQAVEVAQRVTGRTGDYDGRITVNQR